MIEIDLKLMNILENVSKYENKDISLIIIDACNLYSKLYPKIHLLKSMDLNPDIIINEAVLEHHIYDLIKSFR